MEIFPDDVNICCEIDRRPPSSRSCCRCFFAHSHGHKLALRPSSAACSPKFRCKQHAAAMVGSKMVVFSGDSGHRLLDDTKILSLDHHQMDVVRSCGCAKVIVCRQR